MEQDEELDEQITSYINGKMDAGELSRFEARLASDSLLKKEVEHQRQLRSYFNKDLVDFSRSLKEAELRHRQKKTPTLSGQNSFFSKRWVKQLAVAASIILIAGIFYVTINNEDVVKIAKQDSMDGMSKITTKKEDSIAVADLLFYSGKYALYIEKAHQLLKENPQLTDRNILNINICKSYIQLNQAERVISFYGSLAEEEKQDCYLQYQVALAYAILKNKREALTLFELVAGKGCFPDDKKATEWIKRLS